MTPRLILSLAILGWFLTACATAGQSTLPHQTVDTVQPDSLPFTVDSIAKNVQSLTGKKVKVIGNFSGWQGKCTGRPPVSRSDWMIESETACIYVNGRLPPEFSSIPPAKGIGKPIVVIGNIEIDERGKAYLKSERTSVREPFPHE